MKKLKKTILSLLLTLVLVSGITPVSNLGGIQATTVEAAFPDSKSSSNKNTTKKTTTKKVSNTKKNSSKQTSSSSYVWIPRTGSKYHSRSSCSNMRSPSKVKKSEAIRRGYTPCSKCY